MNAGLSSLTSMIKHPLAVPRTQNGRPYSAGHGSGTNFSSCHRGASPPLPPSCSIV
uniref:Uncharacterized protein n=1 Tax=Arundo donax TaxID=35708 RepID=A0A0A8ZT60_ARUDO